MVSTLPEETRGYFPRWKLKTGGVIMPDERLSCSQTIFSGLQHGVAMTGGTIVAPLIMVLIRTSRYSSRASVR
jgi:putative pyrimidine permease RutG